MSDIEFSNVHIVVYILYVYIEKRVMCSDKRTWKIGRKIMREKMMPTSCNWGKRNITIYKNKNSGDSVWGAVKCKV